MVKLEDLAWRYWSHDGERVTISSIVAANLGARGEATTPLVTRANAEAYAAAWKDAVIEQLIAMHIYRKEHEDDPRKALNDLINWHCTIALDPQVSEQAAELVKQARREAWIDPNDKTQKQFLPHIGETVLFCCGGNTYWGRHDGKYFVSGFGVTSLEATTEECHWMYPPKAIRALGDEK